MKSKTSLSLIEQLIMIGVFAVAAAISLRIFAYSARTSEAAELKDFAVNQTRNAAEVIKACGGDFEIASKLLEGSLENGSITVFYSEAMETSDEKSPYILAIDETTPDGSLVGSAEISFSNGDNEIYSLRVCWQEDLK